MVCHVQREATKSSLNMVSTKTWEKMKADEELEAGNEDKIQVRELPADTGRWRLEIGSRRNPDYERILLIVNNYYCYS